MDLPVFRKGLELVSSQLNKLSQGIRAAQITSVIGGSFSRTPAGTTLVINPQTGGSGSGGGAILPCPFKASNASTEIKQQVEIDQGTVETGNPLNPYQWPDGMGIGFPPYLLEITGEGYLYLKVVFTIPEYVVSDQPDGISFEFSETLKANTQTDQYILMATISWENDAIKLVSNMCEKPIVNACSLIYVPV